MEAIQDEPMARPQQRAVRACQQTALPRPIDRGSETRSPHVLRPPRGRMQRLRRDLRAIAADGAAANVMVGIGETYLPAFVLALSGSPLACGLAATVPMLFGALLQLVSPLAVRRLGSYRRWVVVCAVAQALVFLPLVVGAAVGAMPIWLAYFVISLYWATGLGGAGAWNAWAGTLVPNAVRTSFFARRTAITQAALFIGLVVGGLALQAGNRGNHAMAAFALILTAAGASRAVSAWFLSRQSEPIQPDPLRRGLSVAEVMDAVRHHPTGRTLVYLFAAQTAVQISGPYFTPFMLQQAGFSYLQYVSLLAIAYAAKVAALPWLGRLVDRWGAERLLWLGGIAIVPVAGLWNVSQSFGYLCCVQCLSGVAWATYELAMLLIFFHVIPREHRVQVTTLFNVANAAAYLFGSLIGAALLSHWGGGRTAYLGLFLMSSGLRIVALATLAWARRAGAADRPSDSSGIVARGAARRHPASGMPMAAGIAHSIVGPVSAPSGAPLAAVVVTPHAMFAMASDGLSPAEGSAVNRAEGDDASESPRAEAPGVEEVADIATIAPSDTACEPTVIGPLVFRIDRSTAATPKRVSRDAAA